MEALGILIGAGLAALSPLIPGLRPVTKAVIKGGMAVADAATGIAAATAAGWSGLTHEVTTARAADAPTAAEMPAGEAPPVDAPVMDTAGGAAAPTVAGVAAAATAAGQAAGSSTSDGQDVPGAAVQEHDLTQVNGIGPKVAALLNDAGITTLGQLAATDVETLQTILAGAGTRYRAVNPESWPEQAGQILKPAG